MFTTIKILTPYLPGVPARCYQPDDQHRDAVEGLLQLRTEHQPHDRREVDPGGLGGSWDLIKITALTPGEEQGLHERQKGGQGVRGRHQVKYNVSCAANISNSGG